MNACSSSGESVSTVDEVRQKLSAYLITADQMEKHPHWIFDDQKILKGRVHSFESSMGGGKTEKILRFLSENPEFRVAWLESEFLLFPKSFEERGVSLSRILFCEVGSDGVWALMEMIQSGLFPVIICDAQSLVSKGSLWSQEKQWRRIHVAAQKSQCAVLIWRESYEKAKTSRVVYLHSESPARGNGRRQREKTA